MTSEEALIILFEVLEDVEDSDIWIVHGTFFDQIDGIDEFNDYRSESYRKAMGLARELDYEQRAARKAEIQSQFEKAYPKIS